LVNKYSIWQPCSQHVWHFWPASENLWKISNWIVDKEVHFSSPKSGRHFLRVHSRVARLFLVKFTKTGEYTKWP
jgi:hypothetical protein